ncbi:MAG: IS66 family transposase [Ideonella sp.]|nr:IS66 family transposase [Ideonella sp.]
MIRPEATTAHHDAQGQACGCTACGACLRSLGADVSHQLEYVPGRFKVIRTVRPKLACTQCESIFQALAPSRPIPRGLAGPALLAHVMVGKFCDHIPLHRQSGIYARDGVELDRGTLAGWVAQVHALLQPLVASLGRYVLQAAKVHADDTPVKVLERAAARPEPAGCGCMCATTDQQAARQRRRLGTATRPTARASIPTNTCASSAASCRPTPTPAGAAAYGSGRVAEAACWAHARRPWWDLYEQHQRTQRGDEQGLAAQALRRIQALYAIEAEVRGKPPDIRRQQRQAQAGPLMAEFHQWLHGVLARSPASPTWPRPRATAWCAGPR